MEQSCIFKHESHLCVRWSVCHAILTDEKKSLLYKKKKNLTPPWSIHENRDPWLGGCRLTFIIDKFCPKVEDMD